MRNITAKDLRKRMDEKQDLLVLNVLGKDAFDAKRIPGSRNVPESHPKFVEQVTELAGSKDRHIVVHCSSPECTTSADAAKKLTQAGFTNVTRFEGGIKEWIANGYEVHGTTPAGRPESREAGRQPAMQTR
jgi:rhodanese-related sulfurtransferase